MHHVFLAVEFAFYVGAASTLTLTIVALIVAGNTDQHEAEPLAFLEAAAAVWLFRSRAPRRR